MTDFRRDPELISAFIDAVTAYGPREVARLVPGVNASDVVRWRNAGGTRLSAEKRRALLAFLQDREAGAETSEDAAGWLRDFEGMVRMVGGRGDRDDDERRRLQRDIVNSYIDAMKARGAEVPAALYELLGRLDRGEL